MVDWRRWVQIKERFEILAEESLFRAEGKEGLTKIFEQGNDIMKAMSKEV